jgi:hypothetical protein
MRWSERRDGAVAVYDENDDQDLMIVEPVVERLTPTHAGRCRCGGALSFRCVTDGTNEIFCFRCHTTLARIELGAKVYR